MRKNRLDT